jgi:hypothetical protein
MTPRVALASLFIACLLCVPAMASQPDGLVGRLITNPLVTVRPVDPNGLPGIACGGFHWGEFFDSHQLDPSDTLRLEMAIIPFRSGDTTVALGESVGSSAFVHFEFRDGLVNGLPYNRYGWNDVAVEMHAAGQDFTLSVNGVRGGPFAYDSQCQRLGGCFTVQAFALSGNLLEDSAIAWVDSIFLISESAAGQEVLFEQSFETCSPPRVFLGGLLISDPPRRPRIGR